MSASTFIAGRWCYGVRCWRCSRPIPLMDDQAQGEGAAIAFADRKGISLRAACEHDDCLHEGTYPLEKIVRFQIP